MFKGEKTDGINFYNHLLSNNNFTSALGKVSLSAGKLEAELISYFKHNNLNNNLDKSTLGALIKIGTKNKLLDKNILNSLNVICQQRNYLSHNIYSLFIDLKDETILPKRKLVDTDVIIYIEKAFELSENLNDLAEIIKNKYT